jgi:hypothetical protein
MRLLEARIRHAAGIVGGDLSGTTVRLSEGMREQHINDVGLTTSSQGSIDSSNERIMRAVK